MTPQEKLHAVETAIRKALPRLMEIREGCLVIFRNTKNKKQSGKILYLYGQDFYRIFCKNESDEYFRRRNEVEIIGHDILLSDVLEWLGTLFHFSIDHKGIIYKEFDYYFEGGLDRDYTEVARVDFSKPRLADQSEELWNFLYNLLEDNE